MSDTLNSTPLSDEFASDIEHLDDSDSPVMVDGDEEGVPDTKWYEELDDVLSEGFVDQGIIKSICKCRNIPAKYRPSVWKICLNVASRSDSMSSWDGKLDLSNQDELKQNCVKIVDKILDEQPELELEGFERETSIEDAMAVVTFYCKCRAVKYQKDNGFMQILQPLLEISLSRGDLYNCFYAIMSRYVPRSDMSANVTKVPYNLLRLLLLYHDPEMCSFLDTCKISTESFSRSWFSTLFGSNCSATVVSAIWDIYLQKSDPFFILYLALVILVNAKEQVMTTNSDKPDQNEVIETLSNAPSVLTVEDVTDFCQLASYYSERTPSSFRRELGGCFYSGTMVTNASKVDSIASDLSQAFCLKVSIPELLLSSQPSHSSDDGDGPQIRFFVVDCRAAQEYNKGHLLTAFHLDATLMLKEPVEFAAALSSLFAAQEQAIQAGSAAGGEHLCFLGSGTEEEDQYMYMVIANLLQKHRTYVSLARGGYSSLIEYLSDVGIDLSEWIVGAERTNAPAAKSNKETVKQENAENKGQGMRNLMKKMAGNILENSVKIKEKVTNFIENVDEEWNVQERHIEASVKGKPYRGTESVFSIGDENEHEDEDDEEGGRNHQQHPSTSTSGQEIEELGAWTSRPEVRFCYECKAVSDEGTLLPAYLLVTDEEMRCLLVVKARKGRRQQQSRQTWVRARPPRYLRAIVKITSRRSFPELITFKFGDMDTDLSEPDPPVIAADRYVLPDAGGATKEIKYLIIEVEKRLKAERPPPEDGALDETEKST